MNNPSPFDKELIVSQAFTKAFYVSTFSGIMNNHHGARESVWGVVDSFNCFLNYDFKYLKKVSNTDISKEKSLNLSSRSRSSFKV